MEQYKMGWCYKIGDKISGKYHGVSYSGTIRIARRHTMRHDLTELTIDLENIINIYGTDRNSIIVSILDNGKEY